MLAVREIEVPDDGNCLYTSIALNALLQSFTDLHSGEPQLEALQRTATQLFGAEWTESHFHVLVPVLARFNGVWDEETLLFMAEPIFLLRQQVIGHMEANFAEYFTHYKAQYQVDYPDAPLTEDHFREYLVRQGLVNSWGSALEIRAIREISGIPINVQVVDARSPEPRVDSLPEESLNLIFHDKTDKRHYTFLLHEQHIPVKTAAPAHAPDEEEGILNLRIRAGARRPTSLSRQEIVAAESRPRSHAMTSPTGAFLLGPQGAPRRHMHSLRSPGARTTRDLAPASSPLASMGSPLGSIRSAPMGVGSPIRKKTTSTKKTARALAYRRPGKPNTTSMPATNPLRAQLSKLGDAKAMLVSALQTDTKNEYRLNALQNYLLTIKETSTFENCSNYLFLCENFYERPDFLLDPRFQTLARAFRTGGPYTKEFFLNGAKLITEILLASGKKLADVTVDVQTKAALFIYSQLSVEHIHELYELCDRLAGKDVLEGAVALGVWESAAHCVVNFSVEEFHYTQLAIFSREQALVIASLYPALIMQNPAYGRETADRLEHLQQYVALVLRKCTDLSEANDYIAKVETVLRERKFALHRGDFLSKESRATLALLQIKDAIENETVPADTRAAHINVILEYVLGGRPTGAGAAAPMPGLLDTYQQVRSFYEKYQQIVKKPHFLLNNKLFEYIPEIFRGTENSFERAIKECRRIQTLSQERKSDLQDLFRDGLTALFDDYVERHTSVAEDRYRAAFIDLNQAYETYQELTGVRHEGCTSKLRAYLWEMLKQAPVNSLATIQNVRDCYRTYRGLITITNSTGHPEVIHDEEIRANLKELVTRNEDYQACSEVFTELANTSPLTVIASKIQACLDKGGKEKELDDLKRAHIPKKYATEFDFLIAHRRTLFSKGSDNLREKLEAFEALEHIADSEALKEIIFMKKLAFFIETHPFERMIEILSPLQNTAPTERTQALMLIYQIQCILRQKTLVLYDESGTAISADSNALDQLNRLIQTAKEKGISLFEAKSPLFPLFFDAYRHLSIDRATRNDLPCRFMTTPSRLTPPIAEARRASSSGSMVFLSVDDLREKTKLEINGKLEEIKRNLLTKFINNKDKSPLKRFLALKIYQTLDMFGDGIPINAHIQRLREVEFKQEFDLALKANTFGSNEFLHNWKMLNDLLASAEITILPPTYPVAHAAHMHTSASRASLGHASIRSGMSSTLRTPDPRLERSYSRSTGNLGSATTLAGTAVGSPGDSRASPDSSATSLRPRSEATMTVRNVMEELDAAGVPLGTEAGLSKRV